MLSLCGLLNHPTHLINTENVIEYSIKNTLTFIMWGLYYFRQARSVSWRLMPWLLELQSHQHTYNWVCRIKPLCFLLAGYKLTDSFQHNRKCRLCVCSVAMVNSLWPSGAIWQHRSESTLAQIMASCPMALNHYLNQCLCIINGNLWHLPKSNISVRAQDIDSWNEYVVKLS